MKQHTLFLIVTVLALAGMMLVPAAAAAQQITDKPAIAQGDTTKDAVKVSVPEVPEKFKPLLGKWESDSAKFPATFVVERIDDAGNAKLQYKLGDLNVPMTGVSSIDAEKKLKFRLEGGTISQITWDLEYATTFGGMLSGTGNLSGATWQGKFYKVK